MRTGTPITYSMSCRSLLRNQKASDQDRQALTLLTTAHAQERQATKNDGVQKWGARCDVGAEGMCILNFRTRYLLDSAWFVCQNTLTVPDAVAASAFPTDVDPVKPILRTSLLLASS